MLGRTGRLWSQSADWSSCARAAQSKIMCARFMVLVLCCVSQVHGFAPPVCGSGLDVFGTAVSRRFFHENRANYQRQPALRMLSGPFRNVFGLLNRPKQDSAREEARKMYKSQLLEVVKRKQSRSNRVETEEILEKLVESNKVTEY